MLGTAATGTNRPLILISVDGGEGQRITIDKAANLYTFAENLQYGEHSIRVIKLSEAIYNPLMVSYIRVMSNGSQEAALLVPPALPKRRIEFIGDSITCGFGVLSSSSSDPFTTAQEDGMQTYAALTTAAFKADAHYICASGKGVVKDINGNTDQPFSKIFLSTSYQESIPWNFSTWQADVVVINAGTNDCSAKVTNDEFTAGAIDFLKLVRKEYPKAEIIWCYGMMNTNMKPAITDAVDQFNSTDGHAHYLFFNNVQGNEVGACGHPNALGHKNRAPLLIDKIAEITGWSKNL